MSKDNNTAGIKQVDLICERAEIIGNITTPNDIRIDGNVNGDITTTGRLVIGANARVSGNIKCANIDCLGYVEGDVHSSGLVSLKEMAVVKGTISTQRISIEPGVKFNGTCQTSDSTEAEQ